MRKKHALDVRATALEELFFRTQEAQLLKQKAQLHTMGENQKNLSKISGITNPDILDRLTALHVTPAVVTTIALIPLVEVAWVDGEVSDAERVAILNAVSKGIGGMGANVEILDYWLKHRPSHRLMEAWLHYIKGLCENMSADERNALKEEVLGHARAIAEAAGGFLGLTSPISKAEENVLKQLEDAF